MEPDDAALRSVANSPPVQEDGNDGLEPANQNGLPLTSRERNKKTYWQNRRAASKARIAQVREEKHLNLLAVSRFSYLRSI